MHYSPIAVGLLEMNGDLNKFNETMTTGYKVIDGYNLQMQSMANQIELAKNNFMALNATAFDSIKEGFLPLIKLFNETSGSLREMNSILPVLSSSLAVDERCKTCRYLKLCRGGCRWHKEVDENGEYHNRFCKSYTMFFDKNLDKLIDVANYVIKVRMENSR